jgi:hypothetical protein
VEEKYGPGRSKPESNLEATLRGPDGFSAG